MEVAPLVKAEALVLKYREMQKVVVEMTILMKTPVKKRVNQERDVLEEGVEEEADIVMKRYQSIIRVEER
jgi:hypothetical protein